MSPAFFREERNETTIIAEFYHHYEWSQHHNLLHVSRNANVSATSSVGYNVLGVSPEDADKR